MVNIRATNVICKDTATAEVCSMQYVSGMNAGTNTGLLSIS